MSAKSGIEWTDATWNPTVGCTKVSPGCDNCYAETLVNRFAGSNSGFPNRFDVMTLRDDSFMRKPMTWKRPRMIFVNSLSDLFHDDVPIETIADVFGVMAATPRHTFQLLTKRHARMRSLLTYSTFVDMVRDRAAQDEYRIEWPLPNLWLGVSTENQQWADIRIPHLLETPAAVRWISAEPLLGRVSLGAGFAEGLDWVVVGGESGAAARPMDANWVRALRDECNGVGVPFLFKQWGGRTAKANGRQLDGRTWDEYPMPGFDPDRTTTEARREHVTAPPKTSVNPESLETP